MRNHEYDFDLVVVGASFAGAATALAAEQNAFRVCVLESQRAKRHHSLPNVTRDRRKDDELRHHQQSKLDR